MMNKWEMVDVKITKVEKLPVSREAWVAVGQPVRYTLADGSTNVENTTWKDPALRVGDTVKRYRNPPFAE